MCNDVMETIHLPITNYTLSLFLNLLFLPFVQKIWNTTCEESPELKYFYARKVNCKTGNRVFSFDVTDT